MRASFQASITNEAGNTLRAAPQALFVVPNIPPRANAGNNVFESVFSDIYKIGSTCRVVNVINVKPPGSIIIYWAVTTKGSEVNLYIFNNIGRRIQPSFSNNNYTMDIFHNPETLSSTTAPFTSILSFVVPNDKSTYEFRAFTTAGNHNINFPQTYQNCQVVTSN